MRRGRRKGTTKDKVFGCDLLEHLAASSQEIPQVLRSCSEFIEEYGIVDGIYRLSGVSSNTQKLRGEFDVEGVPDLSKEVYRQDIHCVSSLCKAYFRELPNPLLTYQLYDKFADAVAVQLEEERLVKIKEVLKDLPLPHYRTLEYLMRHLVKMATFASQTNMHARNLAIVWAPNLLRSKDIEATGLNGTAAFMEVRVQSIVVEFILTHVSQVFSSPGHTPERRQSLPSPSAMSNQEEPFFRAIPLNIPNVLGPGNGPPAMRSYHAIIEGTDKRKGSLKGRKWKSIFNLGGRLQDPRRKNKSPYKEKEQGGLRPAKSMDSLSSAPYTPEGTRQHPSLSPLTQPSPTLGREVGTPGGVLGGAVGGASSGYAVTYRRGGGACVSVVSGGGVQGTYSRLDSGEPNEGCSLPPQPRSPGMTSRAERRAGMHISGPFSVTVPLHITSGLALGVLQGGGHKEEGGTQREEDGAHKDEGGSHREEDGAHKEEGGAHGEEGGAHREEGGAHKEEGGAHREANGGSHAEEGREGRTAEERKRDKSREDEVEGKKTEVNRSEEGSGEEGRGEEGTTEHFSVEETEPEEEALAEEDQDYMDMRRVFPLEDSQLPLDFQDTFGFLDLMDSSAYNQANEFSVEPPCYEEDDYEEELGYQGDAPSIVISERPTQLPLTHRPLTTDPHGPPCKSHSLPYKSCPFQPALFSTSSSEDEENEEEGSDEEEDMLFYSLPSSLQFHVTKGGEEGANKMADADARLAAGLTAQQELNTNASTSHSINATSSVNASGQSEGELEHSVDGDWLVALAKPGEIGDDGTEEEDSLELKKKMEEEGETPENTASGESVQAVALTDTNGLGCGEGESGFAVSEDQEEYEDHCGPEQSERDHAAEHSATEQSERDHAAEHSATEQSKGDHTAEHSATEQSERDHTAEHSATEQSERDHTAEPSTTEDKERDHAAEHSATEQSERDHAADHSATEQNERNHTTEHPEPKERDHVAEHSTTEPKERDHVAEHSTTEPKERDHVAEHSTTEPKERDHVAEHSTTEPKERDHVAEHSTTEPKERDHAAEQTPTEHSERDHVAEHSTTEPKERDHTAEQTPTEHSERDHAAEPSTTEPKERDHAAELSTTEHRERLHNDTGPESTAESHHGSPEDPEGCHGDSVSGTKVAAELMECSESPEPCPLPLPEPPWGPHTCAHLFLEPPTTTPGEQEDTCREEGGERELEGGREGGGEREEEGGREGGRENNTESHNQLDVQEKEKRKEKREESQERKVTSAGPEEGRGERDPRTERENVQKHEAQVNERERDEERSKGGEEDRGQGATQGRSAREEGRREGRSPVVGPSVARKLVRSKQVTPRLHQAKAVPVVPPKPQLCKLTALTLRREREREGAGDRDGERAPSGDGEKEEQRRGEAEREKGGEGEEENQGEVERLGEDGRSAEKETKRNSGVSVCFDVAVARATERRGRERERGKDGQVDGRRGAEKD